MGAKFLFRGDRRVDSEFDWLTPAEELEVPLEEARAQYEEALRQAMHPGSRPAEDLYLEWLAGRPPAEHVTYPGRHALTMQTGLRRGRTQARRSRVPGKRPLTAHLDGPRPDAAPHPDRASFPEGYDFVLRTGRTDSHGAPLPGEVAARLGRFVGSEATRAARVHTDEIGARIAAAHRARAVAIGERIFFARGEYAPGTRRGDELLAHELTHVAQAQRGALARAAAKGIDSGDALDPAEAEADLQAKLAVIELHAPEAPPPALAAPAGQPTSTGERAARIAAQRQRLSMAEQNALPAGAPPAPPASRPQAPVAHQPPEMAPAPKPAPAPNGNAYVETFDAPPSKQATELWSQAGTKETTQATAEQAKFEAALQPLPVSLGNTAAVGAKAGGPGGPGGPGATGKAPAAGAKPPAAQPRPTPKPAPVTAGATAAKAVKPTTDKAQLKTAATQVIAALPTTASTISTDPGPAPVTDLAGQADPVRTRAEQQKAVADGAKALEAQKQSILHGRGAAQVQPAKLDEKLKVPAAQAEGAMPALPSVEGMAKFKKLNLPANVQTSFDEVAKPKMDAHLAEAKAKMTQAEAKRDADRAKAVDDAHEKVKQAHADADKQQQQKVAESRTQIANHQTDTLAKQEKEVQKLDQQSGEKKKGTIGKIEARVQADQAKVEGDYKDAQRKADAQKQKGEQDAARKKKEAEDKAKDKSWWDEATDAICDGIKAIADEVDHALSAIGEAIGQLLDSIKQAACQLIDAARDFVCQALSEFGDWLKSAVTALLGSVFPELAAALNDLIDTAVNAAKAAVNAIADKLKSAVTALCDGLKGAINAVIAAFKAAVQAAATFAQALITGDWALVGKMILEGVLKLLGIDPAAFYALIGKAMDSIDKIVEDPGAFVGHLIDAVKLGFKQFGAHFWTHLKDGVVQWLFGTFAEAGIRMPASFDIAGIFDLVAQILGLTWTRLRGKVVKIIGEKNTERLEFVSKYIEALITGGFAGLWEKVQQDLSNLWDMVVGGIKDFLIEKIVQQAIIKIATMWNPAGAIIQLIQTAWNVYQWIRENAQRIFGLVQAVVDSIANIVAGDISGAANWIEQSLAKLVPIAISLLANLLGLGGIADKIKGIIEKIQTSVDNAIDKLIERVMAMFKGKGDDKKDEGGELEVPRELAVPNPILLDHVSPEVAEEIAQTSGDRVIYEGGAGDPKKVTQDILAAHSDAHFDKKTGILTLPALDPAPLQNARSLKELGSLLGKQQGVSRVHLVKSSDQVSFDVEINPRKSVASGGKKRGDHVFAHGLTKLSAELSGSAARKELHGSKAGLERAISSISSSTSHAAFELVVDKPAVAGKEGDAQSQAFGNALQVFRGVFDAFLEKLELVDLAVAIGSSPSDEVVSTNAALGTLRTEWSSLIDTVHDNECTSHLDNKGKALERQGLAILATLKTSFPQALAVLVAAANKPANPGKAPESKTPESKTPESKTSEGEASDAKDPNSKPGSS